MGQKLFNDNVPSLVVGSTTTLTLAITNAGKATRITVGGQQYVVPSTITLSTATSGFNGIDTGSIASNTLYYVYAVLSSNVIGMVISTTSTAPTGFTSSKLLGKMRTAVSAATIAAVATDVSLQPANFGPTPWTTYTMTIGGTTSAPSKGTVVVDRARYRRVGDSMEIEYEFEQSAGGGGGSGDYLFPLPTGFTINNSLVTTGTERITGTGKFSNAVTGLSSVSKAVYMSPYVSLAALRAITSQTSSNNLTNTMQTVASGTDFALSNTEIIYSFSAIVPIAEWAGLYT